MALYKGRKWKRFWAGLLTVAMVAGTPTSAFAAQDMRNAKTVQDMGNVTAAETINKVTTSANSTGDSTSTAVPETNNGSALGSTDTDSDKTGNLTDASTGTPIPTETPVAGEPTTGEPTTGESITGEPTTGESTTEENVDPAGEVQATPTPTPAEEILPSGASIGKNGWIQEGAYWYYYRNNVKSKGLITIGKEKYYLDPNNGRMLTGWRKISGLWYYLKPGRGNMLFGIQTISKNRYYLNKTTGAMETGWQQIDGKWYLFRGNGDGRMITGWRGSGNAKYYFNPTTGIMSEGWTKISGKWNYFKPKGNGCLQYGLLTIGKQKFYTDPKTGIMQTGWRKAGGSWYYFKSGNGNAISGWLKSSGKWYYLRGAGDFRMAYGIITASGKKYFMDTKTGAMVTGWRSSGGNWYYFKPGNGDMAYGELGLMSGTYYLDPVTGIMAQGWKKINEKWYYYQTGGNGKKAFVWKTIGGKKYYFDFSTSNGSMVQGWQDINGKRYYFNETNNDGYMRYGWITTVTGRYHLDENDGHLVGSDLKVKSLSLEGFTSMYANQEKYVVANVVPKGTSALKYTSSNPSVATVNAEGLVSGVAAGTTTITCTATDGTGKTDSINITVIAADNGTSRVEIRDTFKYLNIGCQFKVGSSSRGSCVGKEKVWTSSDPNVASVDQDGYLICKSSGKATVTLTVGTYSDSITFYVGDYSALFRPSNTEIQVNQGSVVNVRILGPKASELETFVSSDGGMRATANSPDYFVGIHLTKKVNGTVAVIGKTGYGCQIKVTGLSYDDARGTSGMKYDAAVSQKLEKLVNNYRKEKGLNSCTINQVCRKASIAMTLTAHRMRALNDQYDCAMHATYQLSVHTYGGSMPSAEFFLEKWKNSPAHNLAMLRDDYTILGAAVYQVTYGYMAVLTIGPTDSIHNVVFRE